MMTALSATSPVAAVAQVAASMPAPQAASSATNRATAPDTVSISAQGQQLAQASHDADSDGDSH